MCTKGFSLLREGKIPIHADGKGNVLEECSVIMTTSGLWWGGANIKID